MNTPSVDGLSETAKRHLQELADAPCWRPANSGEWQIARALTRRGFLCHNPRRGWPPFELTEAGRAAVKELAA